MSKIDAAQQEQIVLQDGPDYEKIQSTLADGWREIYNELDNEHKRAFWRSFISEIRIEWNREHKRVIDIEFF